MSSALRLSIIMVLLLAAAALGMIAYNASQPVAQAGPAPITTGYLVAAHPLPAGTLTRSSSAARPAPRGGHF